MKTVILGRGSSEGLTEYTFQQDTILRGIHLSTASPNSGAALLYYAFVRLGNFTSVALAIPVSGQVGHLISIVSVSDFATSGATTHSLSAYVPLEFRIFQGEVITLCVADNVGTYTGQTHAILYFD